MKTNDKIHSDLNRLLKSKTFSSKEELDDFLKSISGKDIPEQPYDTLTDIEKAQDLIFKAHELFKEDYCAFALYTRALYAFKKEGDSANANLLMKVALEQNKFVPNLLLSQKPIYGIPEFYGMGDENEAQYYAVYAQDVWRVVHGALEWLKKNKINSTKMKVVE